MEEEFRIPLNFLRIIVTFIQRMDNVISFENSAAALKEIQSKLMQLLKSNGMHMYKWKVSETNLLKIVKNEKLDVNHFQNMKKKALALCWKPSLDVQIFQVKLYYRGKLSKRTV